MWSAWAAPQIDSSEDSTGEDVVEQPVSSWAAYAAVADESASAEESDGSAQEVGVAEEAAIEKEVRPKPLSIYQAFRGVKSVLAPRLATTSPQTAWPTIPPNLQDSRFVSFVIEPRLATTSPQTPWATSLL